MNKSDKTKTETAKIDELIKMMGDRILVIPSDEDGERATRGGLVIPATANNDRLLRWGEVIAVGPNTRHISKGDRILYEPNSGFDAEIAGESYLILRERDIHAAAENGDLSAPGLYL